MSVIFDDYLDETRFTILHIVEVSPYFSPSRMLLGLKSRVRILDRSADEWQHAIIISVTPPLDVSLPTRLL
jgi:hypothetical protein